jgi:hypothetical protein
MGFRPPPSDGAALPCSSNGGDGRLDVYLVNFGGSSDGTAVPENCVPGGGAPACSSFVLIEGDLAPSYGSFDVGVRTVLPHELFHAVQNAYDVDTDRYWSEGGAQWAADSLDPTLSDLEHFLPAFFKDPGRPIDLPGGGVVASYFYGSAVWPLFLAQRHGTALIAEALTQEGLLGGSSAKAVDAALLARGSSLAAEFPLFASWNVATGSRAGTGGYPNAATYPESPTRPLELGVSQAGVLAGLSATYFTFPAGQHSYRLTLEADPARLAGRFLPLEGGKANLDKASELPADVTGDGIVVVAGKSALKTDANFTLASVLLPDPPPLPMPTTPPPVPTTPPPTGSMPVPTTPVPTVTPPGGTPPGATPSLTVADTDDGGCSLSSPPRSDGRSGALAPLLGLGLALGAARRRALGRGVLAAFTALAALAPLGCDSSTDGDIKKPGTGGGGGQAGAASGGGGGGGGAGAGGAGAGGGGGASGAAPSCDSARDGLLGPVDDISDGTVNVTTEDGDEKTLFVDASGGGSAMSAASSARVYLSLSNGARVNVTDPDAITSDEWDVALKRSVIYANGGDGGKGGRTVARVTKAFDDVAPADADGATFATESFFDAECTPQLDAIEEVLTTFSDWYEYNGADNTLTPQEQTYLVRRADGTTFKLAIESYYTDPDGVPLTPAPGPDSATYLLRISPL